MTSGRDADDRMWSIGASGLELTARATFICDEAGLPKASCFRFEQASSPQTKDEVRANRTFAPDGLTKLRLSSTPMREHATDLRRTDNAVDCHKSRRGSTRRERTR